MPRRNRRGWAGPYRIDDWPADLRPLLTRIPLDARHAELGTEGSCHWSGKSRYPDEATAWTALVGALVVHNRGSGRRREVRAYGCEGCGGFHLSSMRTPPAHAVPAPRDGTDDDASAALPAAPSVSGVPVTMVSSQPADRSHP